MVTYDDSPAQIARRRADLLEATRPSTVNRSGEHTWTPCPGSGLPLAGAVVESFTADGRRMASGWCASCGSFGGARWTTGQGSRPLDVPVRRKHLPES